MTTLQETQVLTLNIIAGRPIQINPDEWKIVASASATRGNKENTKYCTATITVRSWLHNPEHSIVSFEVSNTLDEYSNSCFVIEGGVESLDVITPGCMSDLIVDACKAVTAYIEEAYGFQAGRVIAQARQACLNTLEPLVM